MQSEKIISLNHRINTKLSKGYVEPKFNENAFTCPHCDVYAQQIWKISRFQYTEDIIDEKCIEAFCKKCEQITLWVKDDTHPNRQMVYPTMKIGPLPNPDMPKDIQDDYNEARNIASASPRSACMLLRLCIERICKEVKGTDLNDKTKKLDKEGFDKNIIMAMDSIRVIGGQAVHPLQMNLQDNEDVVKLLFEIVNDISDHIYSRKKRIEEVYKFLPQSKKSAIEERTKESI